MGERWGGRTETLHHARGPYRTPSNPATLSKHSVFDLRPIVTRGLLAMINATRGCGPGYAYCMLRRAQPGSDVAP